MKTKALSPISVHLMPLACSPFLTASFLFPLTSYHLQLKSQISIDHDSENKRAFGKAEDSEAVR
ncbi:MAG: hypothetical protein HY663_06810 [Chloroflexi bacterium]|nr:hypothetical protein [Chloroflexota bacterium]